MNNWKTHKHGKTKVLVVPAQDPEIHAPPTKDSFEEWITHRGFFLPRDIAEGDANFRQIIPYCVLYKDSGEVFVYDRGTTGGEQRLSNLSSIGVGGHIEPRDAPTDPEYFYDVIASGIDRELVEEVGLLPSIKSIEILYKLLIVLSLSDVDRVHMGLIVLVKMDKNNLNKLDAKKTKDLNGRFVKFEDLLTLNLESWSTHTIGLIRALIEDGEFKWK